MIGKETYLEIHGDRYYERDIKDMDAKQLRMICSFAESEKELNWIKSVCNENLEYIVDNILFKL
jgi:hypothetical protein